MRNYSIAYHGLPVGNHQITMDVEESLFTPFRDAEINSGSGKVTIDLERHASFLVLNVVIDGQLEVPCDRCLERFMQELHFEGRLFVKFSQEIDEPEYDENEGVNNQEDILWMNPGDNYLELGSYIYESMILALPVQRVHPEDEEGESMCDKDMLSRFILAEEIEDDPLSDYYDEDEDEDDLD